MSSTAQVLANRENSLKSTGPRTPGGKLVTSRNGISHGLSSAGDPVLPHEDRAQFNALLDRYKLDFSPSNGHEEFLVVIMVGDRWRLERAGRIENAILGEMLDSPEAILAHVSVIAPQVATNAMPIGNLTGMTDAERTQLLDWIRHDSPR